MWPARQSASSDSDSAVMSSPSTRSSPLSGLSIPAIRLSSVLLPDPEGPISAVNSPAAMSSVTSESTGTICPPRRYDLKSLRMAMKGGACSMPAAFRGLVGSGLQHDPRAVVQPLGGIRDYLGAGRDAAHDFDPVAELVAQLDRRLHHALLAHHVH